ncbi:MAG: riboflavin biosynthesis protein RibF [Elusimicrobia bacterium]|nr:riboflavin biosynthesis protein RibF [Elusimicrobiota bacterium]
MKKKVIAIGMFDGIHSGHQKVLKSAVDYARRNKAESIVFTFDRIPQKQHGNITVLNEKAEFIKSIGIDRVIIIPFERIKNLSADRFCRLYLGNCLVVVVGYNFRFGRNREGSIGDIKNVCKNVIVINPVKSSGHIVSSTGIKKLLISGRIETVNKLLNRRYSFYGRVVEGFGWGRKLGFSTANVLVDDNKILPEGIFIAVVQIGIKKYKAAVYIGKRPTFGGKVKSVEAYILNFSKKIYGKQIKVELISKIRNDRKFSSEEKLVRGIERDLGILKVYFKKHKNKY